MREAIDVIGQVVAWAAIGFSLEFLSWAVLYVMVAP